MQKVLVDREVQLAGDGVGEVAAWLLHQLEVAEGALLAEEGQLVLVAGHRQQHPGLAEQVERDVGEGDLLLQHGACPAHSPRRWESTRASSPRASAAAVGTVSAAGVVVTGAAPLGDLVEGRVPVGLVGGRLEEGSFSSGEEAVTAEDGTTQMETPSPRRVYRSRALRRASSASGACRLAWVWDRPRRERTKTSHSGQSVWVMRASLPSCRRCAWRRAPLPPPGPRRRPRGPACAGTGAVRCTGRCP